MNLFIICEHSPIAYKLIFPISSDQIFTIATILYVYQFVFFLLYFLFIVMNRSERPCLIHLSTSKSDFSPLIYNPPYTFCCKLWFTHISFLSTYNSTRYFYTYISSVIGIKCSFQLYECPKQFLPLFYLPFYNVFN